MNISAKEQQIEVLWQEYEFWKISQQALERVSLFSRTITEIIAYEKYLDQEREMEAHLAAMEIIWHLQDSVKATESPEHLKI